MLRLVLRYAFITLIIFMLLIVLMTLIGMNGGSSLMLYTQTQYSGFRLWDIRSQRVFEILGTNEIGRGPVLIPTWSPNGEEFAFIVREDISTDEKFAVADNLYVSDAFGREIRLLLDNRDSPPLSYSIANPSILWSPDGEKLAFYLDVFTAPHLWILTKNGEIIAETQSRFPEDDSLDGLPTSGLLMWSADSQHLFVVSRHDGLQYQVLNAEVGATLSLSREIELPEGLISIDSLVASPIACELLIYDDTADKVWHFNVRTDTFMLIEEITDNNITTISWSDDGSRIGWVQRDLRDSRVYTLSLADDTVREYYLPPEFANDLSFRIWLPEDPPQVIIRMQRGSFCRNIGQEMSCVDPNFFSASWFGIRP